nr:hypothetical protein CFP56_14365 [Quercus suber]
MNSFTKRLEFWRPTEDGLAFSFIAEADKLVLEQDFEKDEIVKALKEMRGDKAPRMNGYYCGIFQHCWWAIRVAMKAKPVTVAQEFARVAPASSSSPRWPANMTDTKVMTDTKILSAYDSGAKIVKASLDMFNDVEDGAVHMVVIVPFHMHSMFHRQMDINAKIIIYLIILFPPVVQEAFSSHLNGCFSGHNNRLFTLCLSCSL